jgi:flagellar hook-associated protein 3 FlgL
MSIFATSTSAFYDRATLDLNSLRSQAEDLQSQISSGQRLSTSSDDPLAASRLRTLARGDTLAKVDTAAADRASADLNIADSALTQFASYTTRIKELATQASNSTLSSAQRGAIGAELGQIQKDLVSLANTRDGSGQALFGGNAPGDAYTVDPLTGVAGYVGNGAAGELSLGDGQTVARSLTGPEFLSFKDSAGNTTNLMAVVKSLADALQAGGTAAQTAASASLDTLSNALDSITTAQTVVGSRLSWIDLNTERQTAMATSRSAEQADVGGTNTSEAIVRLQELSTVLQASQASFSKLSGLSLFDLIK